MVSYLAVSQTHRLPGKIIKDFDKNRTCLIDGEIDIGGVTDMFRNIPL